MTHTLADPFQPRSHGHRGRLVRWVGHELIELESPRLRIAISVTRGGEVLELRDKSHDLDLLWHGHPDVVSNRGGLSTRPLASGNFLDEFSGGWQEVLPNAQFPVEYRSALLGQHGEAALLPWSWRLVEDTQDQLCVELAVQLRRMPVQLIRRMTLRDDCLRLDEVVENLADTQVHVQWGHHIALGGPVVAAGARWEVPEGTPFTIADDGAGARFEPGAGHWPLADTAGGRVDVAELPPDEGTHCTVIVGPMNLGCAELVNRELDLRVRVEWDPSVFRYCWMWTVTGGVPDWPLWGRHRICTVEPFTSPLLPLDEAAASGQTLSLGARESRRSWVEFSVTATREVRPS